MLETNLKNTNFSNADLQFASFNRAKIVSSIFDKANLRFVKMQKSIIMDSSFYLSNLKNVDLSKSKLSDTIVYGIRSLDNVDYIAMLGGADKVRTAGEIESIFGIFKNMQDITNANSTLNGTIDNEINLVISRAGNFITDLTYDMTK